MGKIQLITFPVADEDEFDFVRAEAKRSAAHTVRARRRKNERGEALAVQSHPGAVAVRKKQLGSG